ncbi:hypothetical protein LL912_01290 [Niabella sp. CC-SYL272]|uniref:hypothetical protein n=1 Tax=Niabella agricola TaxID=2891571 RepID=UPI001F4013B9|nr:hypothetical protein [Niabella agricola]MCF3107403.1 hypothetical protein [Niabella agricola]
MSRKEKSAVKNPCTSAGKQPANDANETQISVICKISGKNLRASAGKQPADYEQKKKNQW